MPLGIIDTQIPDGTALPGTVRLVALDSAAGDAEATGHDTALKKTTYMGVVAVLVPQPSDNDPNDPLFWPRWRKEAAFWVILFNTIIFAVIPGPMLSPATFALAPVLGVSITKVAELSGYHLLVVAAIGPVVSVLAQKYGKRPPFLSAALLGTLGTAICIAGSRGSSYGTLLAGRVVQGLGVTAWESLALSGVGDLFFLHERGWRIAAVVGSSACSVSMTSIVSGVLSERLGYKTLFVAALPFNVVGLLVTVLLLPEMQYRRDLGELQPSPQTSSVVAGDGKTPEGKGNSAGEVSEPESIGSTLSTHPKNTKSQMLAPWSGQTYTNKSIMAHIAGIFVHLANPAVLWVLTTSAVINACFVASSYILSQIYSPPPYGLNIEQNGFIWAGALVGGLLAMPVGSVCDWSAAAMSRWNGGFYEAEFRIPVNVLGAAFAGLGWSLFMWVVENPRADGVYLGAFCLGCLAFSISVPSTSAGLYVLDTFPNHSNEIFILQMMVKNFLYYAFSTFINTWTTNEGAGTVFRVLGIVSLALFTTCVPMCKLSPDDRLQRKQALIQCSSLDVFGKVNRRWINRFYTKH
ncbi:hypothetical protein CPLU01_15526 [Colletotrichum plurivorum]|uniref:Major facilitator superfamily transporter n=1 Tax=Colletotrichum plurivorum TaxID=2175906 RepID=A0A8H6MUB3_9PEZI|nr:hypothetical protein CPLU01_15526 [Colletotrichum plurivorum]